MTRNEQKEHVLPNEGAIGPITEPGRDNDNVDVYEIISVLVRNKKLIISVILAGFLLSCAGSLLLPNIYTATARILPPQKEQGGIGSILGEMGAMVSLAGISIGTGSTSDLYAAMLRSRTINDAIIEQFDLMKMYEWKTRDDAYRILNTKVDVAVDRKTELIDVKVSDKDAQFAARLANAYVSELEKLNIKLNINSAGRERLFLENRLAMVKADLASVEDRLMRFQQNNKAIKIDSQAMAVIESIGRLKGEIASREVELGVLLTAQTEHSPQVKSLREGIEQLKAQLRKLEDSSKGRKVSSDIFIATADVPELGVQYARYLRDFKIQETLFELLVKQYELAKINEAKNTSSIHVLDKAVAPDLKSKPKRSAIVLFATFSIGCLVSLFVLVREKLKTDSPGQWRELLADLRKFKS